LESSARKILYSVLQLMRSLQQLLPLNRSGPLLDARDKIMPVIGNADYLPLQRPHTINAQDARLDQPLFLHQLKVLGDCPIIVSVHHDPLLLQGYGVGILGQHEDSSNQFVVTFHRWDSIAAFPDC
jgi:hypothetical protein